MKTILLLEDNLSEAHLIQEIIKKFKTQYNVEHVWYFKDAINRINAGGIDLLICDLSLPDSRGIETYIKISSKFQQLPIVVLTNLHDSDVAEKLVEVGAQDYIVKDEVNLYGLESAIRNAFIRSSTELDGELAGKILTIEQNLKNYKLSTPMFNEPISNSMPDVFHAFCDAYQIIFDQASNSSVPGFRNLRHIFSNNFAIHRDSLVMLKLSPFDIFEIHNHAFNKSQLSADPDNKKIRQMNDKILFEAMSFLYATYSE